MLRLPLRRAAFATACLIMGGITVTSPGAAVAGASRPDAIDPHAGGQILVTFKESAGSAAVRAAHHEVGGRSLRRLGGIRTDVVRVPDVAAALAEYGARPDVEWVGRDGVVRALDHVSDNQFDRQWNLKDAASNPGAINWHQVYQDGFGEGVLVAVVDSGIGRALTGGFDGFEHEPFSGYDFVNRDALPDDENGHGTHIAGTIAQRTGNPFSDLGPTSQSAAGVAPDARLLAVRILDSEGSGSISNTADGIMYAATSGAKVINLSVGGDYAKPLCDAVKYATDRGAIVIAATGNESETGMTPVSYPGACPGAVAVGGHRWDAVRGSYSNGSCEQAFSAPGGDLSDEGRVGPPQDPRNGILQESTDDSPLGFGFYYDSGTSMAAAHAAGAAAVLMGPPFNKSAADVAQILRATARDLGTPGQDDEYGAGALDLAAAVAAAQTGQIPPLADRLGYWMVASDGGIFSFGDAPFLGSTGAINLNSPIIGMARTNTGRGYWLAAADGGVFPFGDAQFFGSAAGLALKAPIVGVAAFPNGRGYWLVARDGGIFTFGDQRFYGSTGGMQLNRPIVGMAPTRTGLGYWLVASDGGIFSFGDARFWGSTGNLRLNAPIVAIAKTPSGDGYWMVATDGGIFSFGDARFHGSTGNIRLNRPIIGMMPTCYGNGYWLVASDGGVFSFGAAPFLGSTGNIRLNRPIVGSLLAIDHRDRQL